MNFIEEHQEYIAKERAFLDRITGDYTEEDLTFLQEMLDTMRMQRTNESKDNAGNFYEQARRTTGRAILKKWLPEPERKSCLGAANLY